MVPVPAGLEAFALDAHPSAVNLCLSIVSVFLFVPHLAEFFNLDGYVEGPKAGHKSTIFDPCSSPDARRAAVSPSRAEKPALNSSRTGLWRSRPAFVQ